MAELEPVAPDASTLDAFLSALRPPLAFLSHASARTIARTQIPFDALAARGRALQRHLSTATQREAMESLCRALERYGAAPTEERASLVQECCTLLERVEATDAVMPLVYREQSTDPSAALQQLDRPVQFVRGVGPRRAELLRKFGIQTVGDLLYHLPFRYEDRRSVRPIGQAAVGAEVSVVGELIHLEERRVGRARRRILEGIVRDESGWLGLTWYHHMTYFRHRYRTGQRLLIHGKVERAAGNTRRIVHPEIDLAGDESGQGILPVYNKPTSMTVGAMRRLVQEAVVAHADSVPSALPASVAAEAGVIDLPAALRQVHLPAADAPIQELNALTSIAHRSLVFDELFFLQLGLTLRRRSAAQETGTALPRRGDLTDRLATFLPFALTTAQQRVIGDIYADMAQPHPMHRLVQGDVGSGKTIVALCAALVAIENGYQVAFMAPTELLAEQHAATLAPWLEQLGVRSALLTGECSRAQRDQRRAQLGAGEIQLVVGTHALIQEGVRFHALGLGVIDEQHRFGVLQRAALRQLGEAAVRSSVPDMLLMTATPIPRTLALTIYGDLEVSVLDELPPGRQPTRTVIFGESERQRVYQLVKEELDRGRQAYVVYPLVDTSEKEELRDATTMARELGTAVFPGYRIGLVHGRMKADEKEAVMRRFRAADLQLLVSTTVIEVGVDVPNATMMVVEHAERFGLSQLHQLRGRVGRGAGQATCILIAPYHRGDAVYQRLRTMATTTDGFKIAEVDLSLRGPGEFLGTRQSGLPDFRVANLIRDVHLLALAREAADRWVRDDPTLRSPGSAAVRTVLQHRWAGRLGLAAIG